VEKELRFESDKERGRSSLRPGGSRPGRRLTETASHQSNQGQYVFFRPERSTRKPESAACQQDGPCRISRFRHAHLPENGSTASGQIIVIRFR